MSLDDDDLDFAILASPAGIIGIIIVLVILVIVLMNKSECSEKSCPEGQKPVLTENDCYCMEKAK